MIPDEAVEAAERAISALYGAMPGPAYTLARAALEAAAPYMQRANECVCGVNEVRSAIPSMLLAVYREADPQCPASHK